MKIMSVIGSIVCLGIGIIGGYVGSECFGNKKSITTSPSTPTTDTPHVENEDYIKRNKDLQDTVNSLSSQLQTLRRQMKSSDNQSENLKEDLEDAQREVTKLQEQNMDLTHEVRQLRSVCDTQASELNALKSK